MCQKISNPKNTLGLHAGMFEEREGRKMWKVLYMQKDRFSSAQQGFQNAFKHTKTAKKEMQRKTTNRIRSSYREAQIKYHARNQPQDYQQQSQQQWEILKTSSMSRMTPRSWGRTIFFSFQTIKNLFFLPIVVFEKITDAEAWCMMIYVHLIKVWE